MDSKIDYLENIYTNNVQIGEELIEEEIHWCFKCIRFLKSISCCVVFNL